jgi:hypothetical protein
MKHATRSARRNARRPARAVAALCALLLVACNAFAAMGVCIAKVPAVAVALASSDADQAPCAQHAADDRLETLTGDPATPTHCPQDDPGAQVRVGDTPVAGVALISSLPRSPVVRETGSSRGIRSADDSPPTPLYARLSRLLL